MKFYKLQPGDIFSYKDLDTYLKGKNTKVDDRFRNLCERPNINDGPMTYCHEHNDFYYQPKDSLGDEVILHANARRT